MQVVEAALMKDPEERIPSAAEMLRRLEVPVLPRSVPATACELEHGSQIVLREGLSRWIAKGPPKKHTNATSAAIMRAGAAPNHDGTQVDLL